MNNKDIINNFKPHEWEVAFSNIRKEYLYVTEFCRDCGLYRDKRYKIWDSNNNCIGYEK